MKKDKLTERAVATLEKSLNEALDYKYALEESCIVAITDQKGIINYANDNFCKISKYSREELIGKDHRIVNSGYHSKEFIRSLWVTICNGKKWQGELKNKAKDGTTYWVDTTIIPFLNDDGKPYQYLAIRADITERKTLEEQQQLFVSIVNSSTDAILSKTLDGIITTWNRAAEKIFGYAPNEVIGKHISILIPSHLQNEEKEILDKIKKDELIDHYETKRLRKDGSIIDVSLTISPIKNAQGHIIGASKISRDITQQKEVEEKLKATELKFRHTLDNMLEGAQIHDFEWRYIYVNNALANYSTYSKEELIGYTLMERYPGIEQSYLFRTLQRCMNERVTEQLETEFVFPNGTKADFRLSIQPTPEGIFIQSIDITEQKKAEQKILKANRLYSFLSSINQAIVHVKDKQQLFDIACAVAIEEGKFIMAWIAILNENNRLEIVSYGGDKIVAKTIMNQPVDYDDILLRDTPTAMALRLGQTVFSNDTQNDPALLAWKDDMTKLGIHASISLPVFRSGKVAGIFGIHSSTKGFFDKEELALLEEAASDISFALENFEKAQRYKKTEELVIANEKRFRALIEKSSDMKTMTTEEGKLIYCSPSVTKGLGYSPKELLETSIFDLIHPDHVWDFVATCNNILKTPGSSFNFQQLRLHKNGNWVWCEGTLTNLLNEPGVNALVTNFRDISDKKLREEQREFESSNLSALINNTTGFMWSVDKDFNLITANLPFAETMKNLSGKTIERGSDILSLASSKEQLDRFKSYYERAFTGEEFTEIEYNNTPFEFWSEVSFYPIRKGVEIIGTACHSRDITNIKTTEQQLRKSEAFNRAVLNSLNSHIAVIDNHGNIIAVNESWNRFAMENGETVLSRSGVGSNYYNVCDSSAKSGEQKAALAAQGIKDVMNEKAPFFYLEYECHSPQTKRWFGMRALKFESDNRMVVVAHQNISDLKVAELERTKITNDLIQRNKALEEFSYIVSHNLRAPVANILGASSILKDPNLTTKDKDKLRHGINVSVSKLDDVVKDLNHILEIKNEINEKKERVLFAELVETVTMSFKNIILKEGIEIKCDFSKVRGFITNKSYLSSIFYHLISNSIKYRRQKIPCIIQINSYRAKDSVVIIFADNGMGIDLEKYRNQVFGLYKRFHFNVEGKGMGLFMVRTQIEALQGKVSVSSKVNSGTEFKIEFYK